MIEAETTFGETVICSRGPCENNLGRVSTKDNKDGFHLLDYEPDMTTFVDVSVAAHAAVAIDEEGEIWILAGKQYYGFNLNLPPLNRERPNEPGRKVARPIKTNFMRKLNLEAINVKVGSTMIMV